MESLSDSIFWVVENTPSWALWGIAIYAAIGLIYGIYISVKVGADTFTFMNDDAVWAIPLFGVFWPVPVLRSIWARGFGRTKNGASTT